MSDRPDLGPRAVHAYDRLSRDVAALNYVTRVARPKGPLSEVTLRMLNKVLHQANRLYRHESGIPTLPRFDQREPFTMADLVIIVARLSAASIAFEERYPQLTETGKARPRMGTWPA